MHHVSDRTRVGSVYSQMCSLFVNDGRLVEVIATDMKNYRY